MSRASLAGAFPRPHGAPSGRALPIIVPDGWTLRADATTPTPLSVSILADAGGDDRLGFAFSVARGLEERPASLPFRWLYDDEGSRIFDEITRVPEYYQTRTEDGILARAADAIRDAVGDAVLVELGSGSSDKTRRLLDAWCRRGPSSYVPIDVSAGALTPACRALAAAYPPLTTLGIAATYERALPLLSTLGPVCLVFLGSSIGNFEGALLDGFLHRVASALRPGDHFLVGIDLVKDAARLEAAYNDAAGWSAAFTRNLFRRLRRELAVDLDPEAIEHVAFWDDRLEQIDIRARFHHEVRIELPEVGRRFRIAPGELLRTEVSRKFRAPEFARLAARFGLVEKSTWTDPEGLFAVMLLSRQATPRDRQARDPEARWRGELSAIRRRTLDLVAPLCDEDLARQHSPLMSPLLWDLGHIARYEELWLHRALGGAPLRLDGEEAQDDPRFITGEGLPRDFDALLTPRGVRGELALPSRIRSLERLERTREAALATLAAARRTPPVPTRRRLLEGHAVEALVGQHEAQHQETMLAAIALREDLEYAPGFAVPGAAGAAADRRIIGESVLVPAGPCLIGLDESDPEDGPGSYDNERPRHEVFVPAFCIALAPVTAGEWLAFVEEGGYRQPALWTDEGRAWLARTGAFAPQYWVRDGRAWLLRRFGRLEPVDASRPVVHVSWFEADAYARWAGKRLPTEIEWEKAATWDAEARRQRRYPWGDEPPTVEDDPARGMARANLGQRALGPAPVGSFPEGRSFYGCHQMLGDVWEWTASWFSPWPGFQAHPYREYSEVFFGERYRVLRGGSWATLPVAARGTFRNWDFPERRQIFSGVRLCEPL